MKISFLVLTTTALFLSWGNAAEEKKASAQPTAAPYPNYWDANAWEKGSSQSFWRSPSSGTAAKTEKARTIPSKPKQKQSTSFKGFFNRQTER